jgi:diguanylate cyclase (GGDEF)-like protein
VDFAHLAHYSAPTAVTTTIVLASALALALAAAAFLAVWLWRARNETDDRVAAAVQDLSAGMQDTMRELAKAVEAAEAVATTERFREELAASLDLEQVTKRTLEVAAGLPGIEAVALEAAAPEGAQIAATVAIPDEEAAKSTVKLPDNDNLRAVEIVYHYRIDDVDAENALVRAAVVVPLRSEGEPIGQLSAFTRRRDERLGPQAIDELERVANRAGPALENARRYTEARALADLDALTGLHNRRYFHETLAREVSRAHRYGRRLAVIVIDLDNFKSVNDRVGHLAGDAVLAEAAERMLTAVRTADVTCRVGGDEFAAILPESGREDAELLATRIARAVAARPMSGIGTLQLSAGVAELRSGDRPNDLFERADEALYRAKEAGKARTVAAEPA